MSVNRWNPVQEMMTLRDAMDRLFQESFVRMPRANGGTAGQYLIPPADVWESEDEVVIELALPGADPQKVDVTFEQDSVVVAGEIEPLQEGKNWVLRERAHGPFQRRFNLNVPVNADKAGASFHNGILTLHLPKSEAVKPRKIAVKTT
ncbi:MAG TPA: heat-shock protein Hsp20 [Chloroflexi bacterium]|nr:heat-shock protein Hsp20 [Chloroflexota bacterium]